MDDSNSNPLKTILLLAGSFGFAFLLGEAVHELGHYLAHKTYGTPAISIHLDPFGGSRILGVQLLPLDQMGLTSAAGPLANLFLGILTTAGLWRIRMAGLLPFLFWGPVAMIQEGVNLSLGLLTPGGDGSWMIEAGLPRVLLLVTGIVLLLGGILMIARLLPAAGMAAEQGYFSRFIPLVIGIGLLMTIRAIHGALLSRQAAVENIIPLVFALLLSGLAAAAQPVFDRNRSASPDPVVQGVSWQAAATAFTLGAGIFLLQLLVP